MSLKDLITEIVALQIAVNAFYPGLSNPELARPAAPEELRALDSFFAQKGLATPPSLREALAVANGAPHLFSEDFGLLSIEQIITGAVEMTDEAKEAFPDATSIIIGGGNTPEFMGLNMAAKQSDGEVGLVYVTADLFDTEFASLREYLDILKGNLTESLEEEEADRDELPDD